MNSSDIRSIAISLIHNAGNDIDKQKSLFYEKAYSIELVLCPFINISLEGGIDRL